MLVISKAGGDRYTGLLYSILLCIFGNFQRKKHFEEASIKGFVTMVLECGVMGKIETLFQVI